MISKSAPPFFTSSNKESHWQKATIKLIVKSVRSRNMQILHYNPSACLQRAFHSLNSASPPGEKSSVKQTLTRHLSLANHCISKSTALLGGSKWSHHQPTLNPTKRASSNSILQSGLFLVEILISLKFNLL